MALMDDIKNKGQDMMNDPDTRAEIERIARDRNITMEEAKQHYMDTKGEDSI